MPDLLANPRLLAAGRQALAGMRLGQTQPGGGAGAAQTRPRRALARRRPAKPGALSLDAFTSKLPEVGTTIFTVMSRRAAEENALNIGQGFPDYAIDPRLSASLIEVIGEGRNQYAPMEGVGGAARADIAQKLELCYQRRFDPQTEITVTCGGTEALYDAIQVGGGPRR